MSGVAAISRSRDRSFRTSLGRTWFTFPEVRLGYINFFTFSPKQTSKTCFDTRNTNFAILDSSGHLKCFKTRFKDFKVKIFTSPVTRWRSLINHSFSCSVFNLESNKVCLVSLRLAVLEIFTFKVSVLHWVGLGLHSPRLG